MTRVRLVLLVLVLVAAFVVPAAAVASVGQEASFQDNRLLLAAQGGLDRTLQTLRGLGVERLRITVEWDAIAPAAGSSSRPGGFVAGDPGSYPAAGWAPYDAIVVEAAKFGMGVNFDVTGSAPLWATAGGAPAGLQGVWYPSASEFGAFVRAVGRRYGGAYVPRGASGPLPRVDYWSIWNEPNVGTSSLSPQTVGGIEVGPRLYRSLLDAAYGALLGTGHRPGSDTILVGEMASTGHADPGFGLGMQPLRFLRALYCVDSGYRQLRGRAAAARGCPTTAAGSRGFRRAHPGLFQATGWSHHPYHLTMAPDVPSPPVDADWVTFADLPKLERSLDRIQRLYGSGRRLPIYLTESGFETNPPRPDFAISPSLQAAYLNQAEYIAWRDPRVRTLSQYLLQDAPPGGGSSISAFASGLLYINGVRKPSFYSYRLPIWLPKTTARRGQSLELWGCVRPAHVAQSATGQPQTAQIQYQRGSRGQFTTLKRVKITNPRGYFDLRVAPPGSGTMVVAWAYPGGPTIYSRSVAILIRPSGFDPLVPIAILAGVLILGGSLLTWRLRRGSGRAPRTHG